MVLRRNDRRGSRYWKRRTSTPTPPPPYQPALHLIGTDASATPTTERLSLTGSENAVVIYTGEQPVEEATLTVYVSINGGPSIELLMLRWQGRILRAPSGAKLAFGTSDGRDLVVSPVALPDQHPVTTGVSDSITTHRAGPPLWEPEGPSLTLPDYSNGFYVESDGTERWLFIREFDGSIWSPIRCVLLPETGGLNVFCTFKQVAIATYEGVTLTVHGPAGTVFDATQYTMHLPFELTGTTHIVTANDASDFLAKCALAVSGDEIVLPAGTYSLSADFGHSDFVANGNKMQGILIRSESGDPADVVIDGTHTLRFTTSDVTTAAMFKGITIDQSSLVADPLLFLGGKWQFEDCKFVPPPSGLDNFVGQFGTNNPLDVTCLRCEFAGSPGDVINGGGSGTVGNSIMRFIDCEAYEAGPNDASFQCITSHNGLPFEVYGGHYYDAHTNVTANASGSRSFFFFTRFSPGSRDAGVQNATLFGCTWIGGPNSGVSLRLVEHADNYAILCRAIPKDVAVVRTIIANDTQLVMANLIKAPAKASNQRAFDARMGSSTALPQYIANIVDGVHNGLRTGNYSSGPNGSENPTRFSWNTFRNCTVAVSPSDTNPIYLNFHTSVVDNTNTTPINVTLDGMTRITTDYNLWNATGSLDSDFIPGANDLVEAPDFGSNYLPTQGGNLDRTGPGGLVPWVGGTDAFGWVLLYSSTSSPRGARAYPSIIPGEVLFPEYW